MSRKDEKADAIMSIVIGLVFIFVAVLMCVIGVKVKEYMMIPFGLVFGFFGCLSAYFGVIQSKSNLVMTRSSSLRNRGIRCVADISAICTDDNVQVNNSSRQYIECLVENPITGVLMSCSSEKVFEDLQSYGLEKVPVYIHPENPEKYYVDIYEAIQQKNADNGMIDLR